MIMSHDLGTTGNKATLVGPAGEVIASYTARYSSDFGEGGKAEQDPLSWWLAVCVASKELLNQVKGESAGVDAVAFSGQMMGAVLLDKDMSLVRPAIIWADTRASVQAAELSDRIGLDRGYKITGHRFNATYSLPKVMWVRDNEPDVFQRVRHATCAKDYIAYMLTGVLATDPSDASGTNAFDQVKSQWSDEIFSAAGLDHLFPEVVPSTAVIGSVTKDAAASTGLRAGTPVVIGGGDGPMAALGSGVIDSSSGAYTYLGSSSWVSLATSAPIHDPGMRTMTFSHVVPNHYVPTATMQAGGASLQWISEVLEPTDDNSYEDLINEAFDAQAAAEDLYFLPHLLGERSPYWNPNARGAFVGISRHHTRGNLVRAVIEGIAFNLLSGIRAFTANGADIPEIDAIGGAANSQKLLSIFANIWGLQIHQRSLADEATSLGAAIVGGVGIGFFDSFLISKQLSTNLQSIRPNPLSLERASTQFDRFLDAYSRMESWFDRRPA